MGEFQLMAAQVSEYHDALRKQGADAERERIIKRLEQAALDWAQSDFNVSLITNGLIALIKGEYK